MESRISHKLVRRVKDDLFDEEKLDQYNLYILGGNRDLQISVHDSISEKFILLEDYVFPDTSGDESGSTNLRHLFDSHYLLQAGFWNTVTFGIKNEKFTQAPVSLFDDSIASDLLQLNASILTNDRIFNIQPSGSDIVTVFSIPENIHSWLGNFYPRLQIQFMHQSAGLIRGIKEIDNGKEQIYGFIDRFRFHIIAMSASQLKYYNQFPIKQFQDYTKFLILVMNELGMKQEECPVTLYGFLGKDSPHFQELKKYIKDLHLGSRMKSLQWSGVFDEIQEHQFFDIFALTLR